jgi:hypothetical protein
VRRPGSRQFHLKSPRRLARLGDANTRSFRSRLARIVLTRRSFATAGTRRMNVLEEGRGKAKPPPEGGGLPFF